MRDRDSSLIDRLMHLQTSLVSDCLDRMGIRGNVMASRIRPLFPTAKVAGFAMTVHAFPVDEIPTDRNDWYRGELASS